MSSEPRNREEAALTIVGTSARRVDGVEKVTGAAKFACDLIVPGMVFWKNPPAAAIANAVAWRTGARIKDLPIIPEKVWRAIKGKKN